MSASSGLSGSTLSGIPGATRSSSLCCRAGFGLKVIAVPADPSEVGQNAVHNLAGDEEGIPCKRDRIELLERRTGVLRRGTVFHVDQVQILVKWDDGSSGSLRPGVDRFRIVERG
jgi:hypothetical protein